MSVAANQIELRCCQLADELMPTIDELDAMATEPCREWLDDTSWDDYETRGTA